MSFFYQNHMERLRLYISHNNTFATHLHRQAELIVALEGQLAVTVGQNRYLLTPGRGVLVFPNCLHSLCTDEASESRILLCIFEPDFCPQYRKSFQGPPPDDGSFDLALLSSHSRVAVEGLAALTESFDRRESIPAYTGGLIGAYLALLFTDLFASADAPIRPGSASEERSPELEQRILIYLDSHFSEELSLEHLAKEFGVSRFRLSRLFSGKLRTSFPDYVNSRRLEYARYLLSATEASVTDIALESGFGSSRSFFREFKKAFHMTPNAYRRQYIK